MTSTPHQSISRAMPRPNEGIWPGLAEPPCTPVKARIAETLFRRAVWGLDVRVCLPGGEVLGSGDPQSPLMRVHRPEAFFHRLGRHGNIGFGESYMVGDWTSTTLAELLTPFAAKLTTLVPPTLQRLRRWVVARTPVEENNTIDGARENIHRHYDLSNELFAAFLDETMRYSSAMFAGPGGVEDLGDAQRSARTWQSRARGDPDSEEVTNSESGDSYPRHPDAYALIQRLGLCRYV
jgi:cyclopropane-fatty-acyl-phospholipid synthase